MTDISKEAVERLAGAFGRHYGRKAKSHAANHRYAKPDERFAPIAATLRAQAAHIAAQDAKIAKLEAQVQAEKEENRWAYVKAGLEDSTALTVEDAAKVLLDADIERRLAKSPAFFLHFHAWEGYKQGVQDYTTALRAIAGTPKEGE